MSKKLPSTLKRLLLYEETNNVLHHHLGPNRIMWPRRKVGHVLAYASQRLETVSVAFHAAADDFFAKILRYPNYAWPNLRQLVLTSPTLHPRSFPEKIEELLYNAGCVALRMPELQTMELWYALEGSKYACLFQFIATWPRRLKTGEDEADGVRPYKITPCINDSEIVLPKLTLFSTWWISREAYATRRITTVWTAVADKLCKYGWGYKSAVRRPPQLYIVERPPQLPVNAVSWPKKRTYKDAHTLVLSNLVQPCPITLNRSSLNEIIHERNEGVNLM